MNKKIIICCAFIIIFVIVIVTGYFLLKPIAKVGNDTVRMYEFISYAMSEKQFVIERMADDIAFEKIIEETEVRVADEEIIAEMKALGGHCNISYEACRKSILHQKAIEKYASKIQVTANKARSYYEKSKWRYGDREPEFEKIKADIQMEMGVAKYEERLYEIREKCNAVIYE